MPVERVNPYGRLGLLEADSVDTQGRARLLGYSITCIEKALAAIRADESARADACTAEVRR